MTYLEFFANFFTAVCIFLAGRNKVSTWWTGIVASILFGILFYQSKLYADVALQVFFITTSILGWWQWSDNKKVKARDVPVSYAPKIQVVFGVMIAIITTYLYGLMLHSFTDAYAPWVDSAVLAFSVLAQMLLVNRYVQAWPFWLLVNTLSVPLFWSRELYMTSILYSAFWFNAIYSWNTWYKLEKEQNV